MTATPGKAPKKEKEKRQTPEERREALRYNHMMYGPTAGEMRPAAKKIIYGSAYLNHPRFQSLMTAFKKGTAYQFEVTDKGKTYTISTDESLISFDGKVIYYSRPLNRHEENLLLDRTVLLQYQSNDALIHFAFALSRSLSDLGTPQLSYLNHQFYYDNQTLDAGVAEQGPNLLLGSYKHNKAQEKARK